MGMDWLIHVYTRNAWSINLGHWTLEMWTYTNTLAIALVVWRSLDPEFWMACLCHKLYRYVGGSIQGRMLSVGPWSDGMISATSLDFFLFFRVCLVVGFLLSGWSYQTRPIIRRFTSSHLLRKIGSCILCGFCQTGINAIDVLKSRYISEAVPQSWETGTMKRLYAYLKLVITPGNVCPS